MNTTKDQLCPLCGQQNLCALTVKSPLPVSSKSFDCWCKSVEFPPLLDNIPASEQNKTCLCQDCVTKLALVKEV